MDDNIFNYGDLVRLSHYGEVTFGRNPVGVRFVGKNGFIVSEIMHKLNMIGYKVRFAEEDPIFLAVDEIELVKGS